MGECIALRASRREKLPFVGDHQLQCSAARRRSELRAAFRLIYERYHREGLAISNPHGLRILPHQLLDTTWVLLAKRRRRLWGTLSLIEDGAMGLPIEQLYPSEIWRLRRQERRVAELACFALEEQTASENMSVLRSLLRTACKIAARRMIDELVICVHPRRANFYERRLGFEEFGPLRCCPWVCDQPAVAMRLIVDPGSRTAAVIAEGVNETFDHTLPTEFAGLRRADRAYFLRLLDSELASTRPRRVVG